MYQKLTGLLIVTKVFIKVKMKELIFSNIRKDSINKKTNLQFQIKENFNSLGLKIRRI